MYRYLSAMAATAALSMVMAGTPALAQTASCGDFSGAAFGLCNAYCEAMVCGSDNQQATDNACMKVKSKFDALELDPLPCIATANTAPTLDLNFADTGTLNTTATFVSFGDAVPIAVDIKITDADGGDTITSATATLMNALDGTDETLSLSPAGHDLLDGIGGTVTGEGTASLTITGTGTLLQYELILQQVVYDNALGSPTTDDPDPVRTVSVVVSDESADSNTANSIITVEVGCPCSFLSNNDMSVPGLIQLVLRREVSDCGRGGATRLVCLDRFFCEGSLSPTFNSLRLKRNNLSTSGSHNVMAFQTQIFHGAGSLNFGHTCSGFVGAGVDNSEILFFERMVERSAMINPFEQASVFDELIFNACMAGIPPLEARVRAAIEKALAFSNGGTGTACTP